MLTGIGHLQMHVRDLAACRALYGEQLGLTEIARGEGPDGDQLSMFCIGDSILELHEDADAVAEMQSSIRSRAIKFLSMFVYECRDQRT